MQTTYQFEFPTGTSLEAPEQTVHLALYAAAGLFGEARVRLEARYRLDEPNGAILVDGGSEVGDSLVKVYTGLLIREFGEDGFHVRRVEPGSAGTPDRETAARHTETAASVA